MAKKIISPQLAIEIVNVVFVVTLALSVREDMIRMERQPKSY